MKMLRVQFLSPAPPVCPPMFFGLGGFICLGSSVGRAMDWKSMSRQFDPDLRHHRTSDGSDSSTKNKNWPSDDCLWYVLLRWWVSAEALGRFVHWTRFQLCLKTRKMHSLFGRLTQWSEYPAYIRLVRGSSPWSPTNFICLVSSTERIPDYESGDVSSILARGAS